MNSSSSSRRVDLHYDVTLKLCFSWDLVAYSMTKREFVNNLLLFSFENVYDNSE